MLVCLTGVSGNMGHATLKELVLYEKIDKIRVFILKNDPLFKRVKKDLKKYRNRIEIFYGNLANKNDVEEFLKSADYMINMAAVIPPKSDKMPKSAIECNEIGVKNIVSVIEGMVIQPKFIHIASVALYGNRGEAHPYGRVGDPLLVSPFDIYSVTKMRGELAVLESKIQYYAILRQSAMLHEYMLMDNISDGLMFHTAFNAPLEWVTQEDSARLIKNIIKRDIEKNDLDKVFWKRVFNIGAKKENRITGYTTLNDGFKLMGGDAKQMFKPNFNAIRNFHGMWFYDSYLLEDLFHYQMDTCKDYWARMKKKNWYYTFGRIVPQSLISKLIIQRLFKDSNSIKYWYKHKDLAKMYAAFGGIEKYEALGASWDSFHLLDDGILLDGTKINLLEYKNIKNTKLIDYGYDIHKDIYDLTKEDFQNIALLHGGMMKGEFKDLFTPVLFENQDHEEFFMKPYSVYAGHWYNITYREYKWDFDRLSKKDKLYASIWYDSHEKNEDKVYYVDQDFNAHMEDI